MTIAERILPAPLTLNVARRDVTIPEKRLTFGVNETPTGREITATNKHLYLDGKPWLPVMGEFHYSRVPRDEWDEQLRKMKAAGISIVSSYVIWQHHQNQPGKFDFSGNLDLRAFIELCGQYGLMFFLRPGPWVHAEVRFGGLPDFVVDRCFTRSNDPKYLGYVAAFFDAIGEQTKDLLWKNGGPIIGLQIENEYNRVGPLQGQAHIAELKRLLLEAGLDLPLYTVTGWDNAVYPENAALPVFGSYVDEPWSTSTGQLPPKTSYSFLYGTRTEWGLGAVGGISDKADADRDLQTTPFLGAEYGAGVPTMYRRRPVIQPEDITAMVIAKLGSGINLLGYYMFQGGRNPAGLPSREENTAIGGYNDLPKIGYDFQAPLGQYGQAHRVLKCLTPIHAFLAAFGDRLAETATHAPDSLPTTSDDLSTLRWSVRSDGNRGYLFVNNHVRQYRPAPHKDVTFSVTLANTSLTLPPVQISTGDHFIWPLNFDLSGIDLRYITAQPLTKLADQKGDIYVFLAHDDAAVRLAFPAKDNVRLADEDAITSNDIERIFEIDPGYDQHSVTTDSQTVRVIVLPHGEGERATVLPLHGEDHLILTTAHAFSGKQGEIILRQTDNSEFSLRIFPDLPLANRQLQRTGETGTFAKYVASCQKITLPVQADLLQEAQAAPKPDLTGPDGSVLQPKPEAFGAAARWCIHIPKDLAEVANTYLRIDYVGDIARLFVGDEMIDDHFFNGQTWEVGLSRFGDKLDQPLELAILPLRTDAPITFDEPTRTALGDKAEIAELKKLSIAVEYEVQLVAA